MAAVEAHGRVGVGKWKRPGSRGSAGAGIGSRWRAIRKRYKWWQLTLFAIGVIAALSVLGALFFRVGHKPERITTDAPVPAVTTVQFAAALAELTAGSMDRGGTVTALNNGDEFLPALLESIRSATRTINFSVYIWNDGEFSDPILAALTEKQRQGVAVRILLDGLGSIAIPDEEFEPLKQAGARVEKYRTPRFGQLTRFHRRNHRRSIVIDGEVGFTGGMAVADKWLGHAQDPDHWRDMMFKVTGPLARSLQAAFADTWAITSGEILVGPHFYPEEAIETSGGVERFVHLASSPADDDQSMAYFFLVPILAARERVYLASPYFIPDKPLLDALIDRARAGVDVRLLVPGARTDNWLARASSQDRYSVLMEAGVKIYEYEPTFMHAKFGVIDGQWSIIGSPNLNSRSRQLDEENAFGILDSNLGSTLEGIFLDDLKKSAQINLDEWQKRNPLTRLFQTACRVLDDQS
jgi:cardiolipin synthase